MSTEVKTVPAKNVTSYDVNGQEVKLSFDNVRKYLVKGNAPVTDQEVVMFISLCKYNQLNPFLNEAYLIKFSSARGDGSAQMVVSKEAFFKRAESHPMYDGIDSGIIVQRGNEILELDGCFHLASDILLGAWAKVYRKDRSRPVVAKVNLGEFDKGNSIWREKKPTMICKVAKVQALRESFPAQLGAMYTSEEQSVQDVACEEVSKDNAAAQAIMARVAENRSRIVEAMAKNDNPDDSMNDDRHSVMMDVIDSPIEINDSSATLFGEE